MHTVNRTIAAAAVLFSLLAFGAPQSASAANFEFGPPTMELKGTERVATVTLTNSATDSIRFEIEAFRWTQRPDGQLQLDPTDDLIVFPRLVTLAAHETRRIRVAVTAPPGDLEKTYRVQISEVPQFTGLAPQPGATIEMRSQLRLPVFFAPVVAREASAIDNVRVQRGTLTFSLSNSGTTHFMAKNVVVSGRGPASAPAFSQKLDGWYVLAGGHRDYVVSLPQCERIRAITIAADAGSHVVQTIDVPADACRS